MIDKAQKSTPPGRDKQYHRDITGSIANIARREPRTNCVAPPLAHPPRSKTCVSIRSLQCRDNTTYLSSRRIHGVQEVSLQVHTILSLLELLHSIPRGVLAVRCRGRDGPKDVPDNISYCLSGRHFFSFARNPAFLSIKLVNPGTML